MGVIHERIRLNPHVQECAEQVLSEIFLELGPRGRGGPEILQAAGDFRVPEEDLLIVPGSSIFTCLPANLVLVNRPARCTLLRRTSCVACRPVDFCRIYPRRSRQRTCVHESILQSAPSEKRATS